MNDFVARQLLQVAQRTANASSITVGTNPPPNSPLVPGFQFGIAVVMMMALGSCCLVTCCNCLRVGAAVMVNYRNQNDPSNAPGSAAQPTHGRVTRERLRVVQHEWDPNNPDDPVFLVQPDGGVGIAYQMPPTPSAKSVALGPFAERQRRTPRERLAALRACTCMSAPVQEDNESQSAEARGEEDELNSLPANSPPDSARNHSRNANSRSGPRRNTGNKREVGYCSISLDEAVLMQSLADTAAMLEHAGGETNLAQQTAVAMLLEKDDSDDEKPDEKLASTTPADQIPSSAPYDDIIAPDSSPLMPLMTDNSTDPAPEVQSEAPSEGAEAAADASAQ